MYAHLLNHFELDIMHRSRVCSFGLSFGSNKAYMGKAANLFLEIDFLFWTLGFEIKRNRL